MTNRDPKEEYEEDIAWKKAVHSVRMKETVHEDVEFTKKLFETTLATLKKKGGKKYRSILAAGPSFLFMKLSGTQKENQKHGETQFSFSYQKVRKRKKI